MSTEKETEATDASARIRVATTADASAIRSIYAPFVESTPVSFEETAPDEGEVTARIEKTLETHPWLVCERAGEVVGYAKASSLRSMAAYRWTVELSVYVADEARRSGVATGLYRSLLALLELQGYRSAYAALTVPNEASVAFHERLGFESVGVFPRAGYTQGEWRDVRWLYRPIGSSPGESDVDTDTALGTDPVGEPESPPDEPIPFPDVRAHPDWERALSAGESTLEF